MELYFWILFFILLYTYLGYALALLIAVHLKKKIFPAKDENTPGYEPKVCLFVTAYNEKDYIEAKVKNSHQLDYPREKMQYIWVTDGSNDGTPEILSQFKDMEVYHLPERRGKMHAMNRGMHFVKAPIVIFSDTNTLLNNRAIREIVSPFGNSKIGCVAGEKRIIQNQADGAAAAGEGIYWKYESWIKKMDASLNSAVGAVGELFAIRTALFEEVESDTILDDFIISLRIAQKGYRIAYTSNAFAEEAASLNVKEELKRKIRIAAGGIQAVFRLKSLLNPFQFGIFTWQFISHKVFRWALAPFSLFFILFLNGWIVWDNNGWFTSDFFTLFFYFQILCYLLAWVGWYLENKNLHFKFLFLPYYFLAVNYAALRGIFRYFLGKQPAGWEKSKRADSV